MSALLTVGLLSLLLVAASILMQFLKTHLFERSVRLSTLPRRMLLLTLFIAAEIAVSFGLALAIGAWIVVTTSFSQSVSVLTGLVIAALVLKGSNLLYEWRRLGIRRAPGSLLSSIADVFYPPKTRERVFDQIIIDMRAEWCEAMAGGRRFKALVVRVRGVYAFGSAVVAHGLGSILKTAYGIFKATR